MKKQYKLEFTYSNENSFYIYEVEYDKESDKERILQQNVEELISKHKATNIVAKEICIYKIL